MLPDTGKTPDNDTYRTVNLPERIEVEEDASGLPLAVKMLRGQNVSSIEDRWRIDDEWWRREPVSRIYYEVLLSSGQRLQLYKDLITACWYRQSY